MKKFVTILFLLACAQASFGQLSGPLSGTLGPGTYHIIGSISVAEDSTLTLMPGTTFHFDSAYVFAIYGTLLAVGTDTDSIIFTTDTTANPDRWRRLFFDHAGSSGSQLAYCLIEYGYATGGWGSSGGGAYCYESSPAFTHCVIRNNEANYGGGVYCLSSSATFTNCTISGNSSGNDGGGVLFNSSTATLTDCMISDNMSGDDGGGVHCVNSLSPTFTNCTISDNTAVSDGGGISCQSDSSPTFTNCDINDNSASHYGGGVFCENSAPTFTDCAINSNSADNQYGGGMCCRYSSATFTTCTIDSNYCYYNGGGVFCYSSSTNFTNCSIDANRADQDGGGVFCQDSSPTFDNCTICDNYSDRDGGGLNCYTDSSPLVTNCTISDNIAIQRGGGVHCWETTANFVHCAIFDNFSDDDAGGVFTSHGSPVFTNCTISNNTADDLGDAVLCQFATPTFNSTTITFSDDYGIWFWSADGCQVHHCNIFADGGADIGFANGDPSHGPPGIGELVTTNANDDSSDIYLNIMLDPMFVDTAANDYHLLEGSPCIDAGDPTLLPDPDGTIVEIGTFYFPQEPPSYTLSPDSLDFGEVLYRRDSTLSFWIHNPTQEILSAAGIRATDTLIFHANPTSAQIPPQDSVEIELTFTPRRNISYLDSVQIAFAGLDEVDVVIVHGTGIYDCHVLDGPVSGTLSMDCNPYYVAGTITVEEDDTLVIDAGVEVIFDSYCQFIVNGLLMAMGTEQDSIYFTCDTLFNPDRWGGIRFPNAHDSCRLEYCVIEYGRAEGQYPDGPGGGVFCESSSPAFAYCTIRDNWAEDGGGVYCNNQPSPTFTYCAISDNVSDHFGGGVYCAGGSSSPSFLNCTISDNSASGDAGGLYCSSASPILTNCTVSGNSAGSDGGGICLYGASSTPTFTGCTISGNSAIDHGGGLQCTGNASPYLESCTIHDNTTGNDGGGFFGSHSSSSFVGGNISDNSSGDEGGGVYGTYCSLTFTECTITDNASVHGGGGVFIRSDTSTTFTHCTISGNASGEGGGVYCASSSPTFNSTIVSFSEGDGILFNLSPECLFEYCDVYGNTMADIGFVDDDPSHGPADIGQLAMTNANGDSCDTYYNIFLDPMFVDTAANDYHLLTGSPCVDAGDPDLPLDPDGTVTDIGAFYFQSNPPSPFNLLSPANGDTVDTLAVVFIWETSSDPDPGDSIAFYRVYLALDSAFSTGLDSQEVGTAELAWDDLVDGQTYWWRVKAFDTQDNGTFSNQTWSFTSVASAISGEAVQLPTEFALYQNYPNPFNPTTVIRYDVKQTGLVSLKVFDILGREVTTLVHGTIQAGAHTISWDASGLPSGIYLCQMEAPGFEHTRKLVLLK